MLTQTTTGPLTNKIQQIVASRLDTDKELLESLFAVSHVLPANSIRHRRNLRSELEEQLLKLYESLLEELEGVKTDVDAMYSHAECMLSSCRTINDDLSEMKEKTNSFMSKASDLQRENAKSDLKVNILEDLSQNFQLPLSEKELLGSKNTAIDSAFFAALHHARSIEGSCKELMHSNKHNFGMSMLDAIHATLEEAYQHLYLWTQNECRTKTQSTIEISFNLRNSVHELQDRPVLLKYALDDYAGARRTAAVNSFIDALTLGADTVSSHTGHHSKPIELHSHDPLRYASDMLAWIHQLTASESEYLNSLTRLLNESVVTDLRVLCLDKITEGLCSLFKARMEQLMASLQDVVLLYRINNIVRFYEHTLHGILGNAARLSITISDVQELGWRLLLNGLQQYSRQILEQPELPNADLSPSDTVHDTLHLLSQIAEAHDISLLPDELRRGFLKEISTALITPLVSYCSSSADRLARDTVSDSGYFNGSLAVPVGSYATSQQIRSSTYLVNCLYLIEMTVARFDFSEGQVEQFTSLLNTALHTLVSAQVVNILIATHLFPLVRRLEREQELRTGEPLANSREPGLSETELRDALALFDVYLCNPHKFDLTELRLLTAQRLRKLVHRRTADEIHSRYQLIYNALVDPSNGYSFSALTTNQSSARLRTPHQVAELILNF